MTRVVAMAVLVLIPVGFADCRRHVVGEVDDASRAEFPQQSGAAGAHLAR